MAKTSTEKTSKPKVLSSIKSKSKPLAAEPVAVPSGKAEGKRKVAVVTTEEDAPSAKKTKKLSKGKETADTAVIPEQTESKPGKVKESKRGKELKKGEKESVERKVEKKKDVQVGAESDGEDGSPDVTVPPPSKGKKVASSKEKPTVPTTISRPLPTKSKKPSAAKPKSSSVSHEEAAPSDEDKEANSAVEDVHLFGFSTDDDDSSDEEMNDEPDPVEISKLPTIAKDDAVVKQKLEKAKRKPTADDRGVIYLGRVPHGFYEAQMKAYFAQFGEVTRLRLSRNKKTGRSKHYAFIEFDSSSVAQIVAETMDNYLLMGHILTCKVIPKDKVHPELWVGANRKWRAVPTARVARVQHNKARTEEEQEKAEKRLLKRQAQKKRKLEEAGIKYDFEAVAYKKKSKSDA